MSECERENVCECVCGVCVREREREVLTFRLNTDVKKTMAICGLEHLFLHCHRDHSTHMH